MKYAEFEETEKVYARICGWWKEWGWSEVPVAFLPERAIVAYSDGEPVYVGFLVVTDTAMSLLEWIVCDRHASVSAKRDCLRLIVDKAKEENRRLGKLGILTMTNNQGLGNSLRKCGYQLTDENVKHYLI